MLNISTLSYYIDNQISKLWCFFVIDTRFVCRSISIPTDRGVVVLYAYVCLCWCRVHVCPCQTTTTQL